MYTDKMHKSLRRETEGKKNQVVDLLDEIERLQNREAPSRRQSLTMPDGSKLLVGADRKKLIKNINTYFATEIKNIKEINYEDMMWYLDVRFYGIRWFVEHMRILKNPYEGLMNHEYGRSK